MSGAFDYNESRARKQHWRVAIWTIPVAMLVYAAVSAERLWRYSRIEDTNRHEVQVLPVVLLAAWLLVAFALGLLLLRRGGTSRP